MYKRKKNKWIKQEKINFFEIRRVSIHRRI